MCKKILGGIAVLAISAVAALNVNISTKGNIVSSDISLATIEAMAFQEHNLQQCNGTTPFNDVSGVVIFPQAMYVNNADCNFQIDVPNPDKKFMKITIACNTEHNCDFVTVYSVDNSWNIISTSLRVSGPRTVSIVTPVANGKALVNFKSDATFCGTDIGGNLGYTGFSVFWELSNNAIPDLFTNNGYFMGKVGIGIDNPGYPLHVIGNSYLDGNIGIGTYPSSTQRLSVGGNSYFSGNIGIGTTSMTHRLNVTGNSYFNGNVGIGKSDPKSALDVNGEIQTEKLLIKKPSEITNWSDLLQSGFYDSYNVSDAPEPSQWFWGINMGYRNNSSSNRCGGQIVIKNSSGTPTMYFRSTDANGNGTWAKVLHNIGQQTIEQQLHSQLHYTKSTDAYDNNKWIKIASCTITAACQDLGGEINFMGTGSGNEQFYYGKIIARFKNQNASVAPANYYSLLLLNSNLGTENVKAIMNGTQIDIYIRIPSTYTKVLFWQPLKAVSGALTMYDNQSFLSSTELSSLPGTEINCTSRDAMQGTVFNQAFNSESPVHNAKIVYDATYNDANQLKNIIALRNFNIGGNSTDLRQSGIHFSLGNESNANESRKSAQILLESQYTYANWPSLNFYTGNQRRMTILNDGSVGITKTLEVSGDTKVSRLFLSTAHLVFAQPNNGNGAINFGSSGNLFFRSIVNGDTNSYTELMTLQNNGNLGIGTTDPKAKLDIIAEGNPTLTENNVNNGLQIKGTNQALYMGVNSITHTSYIQSVQVGGAANALLLNARGGNVGIGMTPAPNYKLDVDGAIRVKDVKVCLTSGCDFVFADDYKLMNLNDLSDFIKTNKHLPEVAPAREMEAEGINLSEMQAKLLQKIEELTLYTIRQNEKIEMLVKKVEELQNK